MTDIAIHQPDLRVPSLYELQLHKVKGFMKPGSGWQIVYPSVIHRGFICGLVMFYMVFNIF